LSDSDSDEPTPIPPITNDNASTPLWRAIWNPRMLICVFIGFSSGLPLWYLWQLIPYWLRTNDLSLTSIGMFSLLMLPYNWKFVVAPLLDRYVVPGFGRRRGWMFVSQVALMVMIAAMGYFNPEQSIWGIAYLSFAVACAGAIQDIAIDAYRRELLPDNELGMGNAIHVNAYRVAGLVSFSLAVYLSKFADWRMVHLFVALWMIPGAVVSLLVTEPKIYGEPPKTLRKAVIEPFKEFFQRSGGTRTALLVLLFMLLYKFGDNLALALITPFYHDMGFSEEQIAFVTKTIALIAMIVGGFAGGFIMFRIGINRSLWLFGAVQLASILGLAYLATQGNNVWVLAGVVAFEYLGVGLGGAALVAFQAKQSDLRFTATQLSLFTSLMAIPRAFTGPIAGFLIEGNESAGFGGLGYASFFLLCAVTAIPGMLLLFKVAPWTERMDADAATTSVIRSS
jgi:PAT family beta-lactamase induction signal transducer AmpG